jgi:hypothetical protein
LLGKGLGLTDVVANSLDRLQAGPFADCRRRRNLSTPPVDASDRAAAQQRLLTLGDSARAHGVGRIALVDAMCLAPHG